MLLQEYSLIKFATVCLLFVDFLLKYIDIKVSYVIRRLEKIEILYKKELSENGYYNSSI
ncbi:hypothetical protein CLPUN_30180 [Clostridium puniceum]|uniref:Uncharacterized protein n=1 Tax=Clostridium puniceum TaxID=29367 RepID=A0A1S8TEB4_9CLOT|nr:hypothetical protein CLPUN_30180 [Clostridium puniceum]